MLGDTRVLFRYLFYNDGSGPERGCFWRGIVVPSKTRRHLTHFLNGDDKVEHRHFGLSRDLAREFLNYNIIKKGWYHSVFVGGSLTVEEPVGENKYGYKDSRLYDVSVTWLSKTVKTFLSQLVATLTLRHTSRAYWNGNSHRQIQKLLFFPRGLVCCGT